MKLAEISSEPVVAVKPSDSVDEAILQMVEHDIRHLPVVDDNSVVGIISDRDLLVVASWMANWKSLADGPTYIGHKQVAKLMSTPVTVLSPDDRAERAAALMIEGHFSAVPLARDGKLVGIVTESDVLRRILDDEETPRWRQLKVGNHMSPVVVSAKPSDTAITAFRQMKEHSIRHLPVTDRGTIVGLVSDRDLRRAYGREIALNLSQQQPEPGKLYHATLEEVMSRHIQTCGQGDTLASAADRMVRYKIGALPVIEDGDLLGMITEIDLLEAFVAAGER